MSKIHPFRAIFFNPDLVEDFSNAISLLEYRVADVDELRELASKHEYNISQLIEPMIWQPPPIEDIKKLIKDKEDKKAVDDKLAEIKQQEIDEFNRQHGKKFSEWLELGKVYRDEYPGIYLYSREYWDENEKVLKIIHGVEALLEIEPEGSEGGIKLLYSPPDELVEQAYNLKKYTFAQFSPIIVGYSDPKNSVKTFLRTYLEESPILFGYDNEGFAHSIRVIHDEGAIDAMQKIFDNLHFGIIEGAHHYLAAKKFYDEMKRLEHFGTGTENTKNVLAYFVALDGKQLIDFDIVQKFIKFDFANNFKTKEPSHITRLKKELEKKDTDEKTEIQLTDEESEFLEINFDEILPFSETYLKAWAKEYFEIEEIEWNNNDDVRNSIDKKINSDFRSAVLMLPPQKKCFLLKLKDAEKLQSLMGTRKAQAYGFFDLSVFWRSLMRKIFSGFDDDRHSICIWDAKEIFKSISRQEESEVISHVEDIETKLEERTTISSFKLKQRKSNKGIFLPSFMLTSEENEKVNSNIGLSMIFKAPDVSQVLKLFDTEGMLSEQLIRIKYAPMCGFVWFRIAFDEAGEVSEEEINPNPAK